MHKFPPLFEFWCLQAGTKLTDSTNAATIARSSDGSHRVNGVDCAAACGSVHWVAERQLNAGVSFIHGQSCGASARTSIRVEKSRSAVDSRRILMNCGPTVRDIFATAYEDQIAVKIRSVFLRWLCWFSAFKKTAGENPPHVDLAPTAHSIYDCRY